MVALPNIKRFTTSLYGFIAVELQKITEIVVFKTFYAGFEPPAALFPYGRDRPSEIRFWRSRLSSATSSGCFSKRSLRSYGSASMS